MSGSAGAQRGERLSANPNSLNFGSVVVGSSAQNQVILGNFGRRAVQISSITVSGAAFNVSGVSAPVTINSSSSLTLTVAFAPTAAGTAAGSITIDSSASDSSLVIGLSGTGVAGVQPALTITPSTASFGNVTVGNSSSQTLQVSNSGTGTLTITQASISGTGFSLGSLALPISLTAGQASIFNVSFAPQAVGAVTGSLTVLSNAPNSPTVVSLSGTGVAATYTLSFSTTSLAFGSVNTGTSSTLPVMVTSTGNSNVQITQIGESGAGFTLSSASTPVTLTPNQSMTFDVNFAPTAAGSDSGTVTVTSNATGSPTAILLSGTGVVASYSVALSWTASASTVSGYNVYRSTTNGSGYTKLNTVLMTDVDYTDTTVQNGTTYYYVTTAVNSSGVESAYSNQATAVVP